jgi:hypothetical protein
VLLCGTCLAAGCSTEDERTPAACLDLDGGSAVRAALRSAPADVRLGGQPLSACLHEGSDGATLTGVGQAYVEAAAGLAEEAAAKPGGAAATQLGYLIGATRRSEAGAQGAVGELVRRLEQELVRVDERSPAFVEGERAGRRGG